VAVTRAVVGPGGVGVHLHFSPRGRLTRDIAKVAAHIFDKTRSRGTLSVATMGELHVTEPREGVDGPEGTVDLIMGLVE